MHRTLAAVAVGIVLMIGGGCRSLSAEDARVVEYQRRGTPMIMPAPANGSYTLQGSNVAAAKKSFTLKKGDRLGFRADVGTRVVAVAGDEEIPLPDGDYAWVRR